VTSPYLTVKDAADVLGITADAVRKHIRNGKLPAVKRSERTTLIARPAFDAYVRKLNGETAKPLGRAVPVGDLTERLAAFKDEAGSSPESWLKRWLNEVDSSEDTEANMRLAIAAVGLVAEARSGGITADNSGSEPELMYVGGTAKSGQKTASRRARKAASGGRRATA
jgi:excisionase family DNA binding protein